MKWSYELPREPGLYLFYGEVKGYAPQRFALCEVRDEGELVVEGEYLGPDELRGGAFRPFDERPPDRG